MNPGQEKFLGFILARVQDGKEQEAKALLSEHFKKQDEGTFTKEDIQQFAPKVLAMLKPESVEEVKAIMKDFAERQGH